MITKQNSTDRFSTWPQGNAAADLACLSVLTDKQYGDAIPLASPALTEDCAGVNLICLVNCQDEEPDDTV